MLGFHVQCCLRALSICSPIWCPRHHFRHRQPVHQVHHQPHQPQPTSLGSRRRLIPSYSNSSIFFPFDAFPLVLKLASFGSVRFVQFLAHNSRHGCCLHSWSSQDSSFRGHSCCLKLDCSSYSSFLGGSLCSYFMLLEDLLRHSCSTHSFPHTEFGFPSHFVLCPFAGDTILVFVV